MGSGKGAESRAYMLGVFSGKVLLGACPLLAACSIWLCSNCKWKGREVVFFFSNMNSPGYIFAVFGYYSAKCTVHSLYNSKHYAFKICPKLFCKCRVTKQYWGTLSHSEALLNFWQTLLWKWYICSHLKTSDTWSTDEKHVLHCFSFSASSNDIRCFFFFLV